jgi:hypothetical protein
MRLDQFQPSRDVGSSGQGYLSSFAATVVELLIDDGSPNNPA